MAFFELDNFDKTLLYPKVPTYYTFPIGKFCRRKQGEAVAEFPDIKKINTEVLRYFSSRYCRRE